ncbi:hypothetical protein [Providencia sneebia]|uniref:Uncharacterized protein n=1 Tax=Providencia sneebia DSM 19967 TaxID=1141660 RepID=K8WHT7_9GAMM|nr:hypothetical protein [Providencia sneebia]EKT60143.1 hypothetical protein OO7_04929 [Providencia sneebia DSM 19967]
MNIYNINIGSSDFFSDDKIKKDEEIKNLNPQLKIANTIDNLLHSKNDLGKPSLAMETLLSVANHQKQVTLQMLGQNVDSELAITLILKDSINKYTLQLESIYAWTVGGKSVLAPMLKMMSESIFAGNVSSTKFEDLIQIIVIDMMLRGKLPDSMKKVAGYFLEDAGSGTHAPMTQMTPKDLEKFMLDIYQLALKDDPNSLAYSIANTIEKNHKNEFMAYQRSFAANFWTNPDGFMDGFVGNKNIPPITGQSHDVSPFFKLSIISTLSLKGDLSADDFNKILVSDLSTIKDIAGIDGKMVDWIIAETSDVVEWKGNGKDGVGSGQRWWTFPGYGIDYQYLEKIFNEFPPRNLTEEEAEEINRIGDQVKMIQQTLKYWLQICNDERLAMARNI